MEIENIRSKAIYYFLLPKFSVKINHAEFSIHVRVFVQCNVILGWSKYTYEPFGTSCSMNWQGTEIKDITYTIATCITCYAIHVTIIVFCYYKMRNINHLMQ